MAEMNNRKLAFWMKKKLCISEIVCRSGLLVLTALSFSGPLVLPASVTSEARPGVFVVLAVFQVLAFFAWSIPWVLAVFVLCLPLAALPALWQEGGTAFLVFVCKNSGVLFCFNKVLSGDFWAGFLSASSLYFWLEEGSCGRLSA